MKNTGLTIQEYIDIYSRISAIGSLLIEKGICTEKELRDNIDEYTSLIEQREDIRKSLILEKMYKEILSDEEKEFLKTHLTQEDLELMGGDCDKYINAMETFVKSKNEDGLDFGSALFRSLGSML